MSIFDFKVWRVKETVFTQILSQPEEIRAKGKVYENPIRDMGIYSTYAPKLNGFSVGIRGKDKDKDLEIVSYTFDNEKMAEAYCEAVRETLELFAFYCEEKQKEKEVYKGKQLLFHFDIIGCAVVVTPLQIPKISNNFAEFNKTLQEIINKSLEIAEQSALVFGSEEEAQKWVQQAEQAIAEYNARL